MQLSGKARDFKLLKLTYISYLEVVYPQSQTVSKPELILKKKVFYLSSKITFEDELQKSIKVLAEVL